MWRGGIEERATCMVSWRINSTKLSNKIKLNKMEETLNNLETKPCTIHGVVCCGVLEKMNLGWMKLEDGTKCMPHIKGHSDEVMYRVNNCPSCGKYVRDVMI